MKKNRFSIHNGLFFVLIACLIPHSTHADDDLASILKQSMQIAREIPFDGRLSFCRKVSPESSTQFVTKVKICRQSADRERMEVLEPEVLKGHLVINQGEDIWVTPLTEEIRKQLPPFHYWFRLFHDVTGTLDLHQFDLLLENYNLIEEKSDSIANRQTQVIFIQSKHLDKDRKRPSMRFWIDRETRMPLKCQQFSYSEDLLETIQFDEIRVGPSDSPCDIQTDRLIKLSPPPDNSEEKPSLDFCPLKPENLPRGFKEIATHIFLRKDNVVLETNYTDGLTMFSTYQRRQTEEEKEAQAKEPEEERWKVKKFKDKELFYREIEGIRIVAVGELGERSMNFVLYNMQAQKPAPETDSVHEKH